jgi:hypothetical protein
MRKINLCAAAMLGVAATIFGGYYFVTKDVQETEVQPDQMSQDLIGNEATDNGIPMQRRGGAWYAEAGSTPVPNGIANALSQRQNYFNSQMPTDGFGDGAECVGVPTNWLQRGPQNLGGRTEAIVLHPNNGWTQGARGTIWAGGSTGGVWKSFNRGLNWYSTNSDLQNYNVSCMVMDPANSDILYAGTGQSDGASLLGGGVFRSTDGGMTWVRLQLTYDHKWSAVNGLAVTHDDSTPPNTVLLAAVENYDSRIINPGADRGIMRSTNGGVDWTKVPLPVVTPSPDTASFVGFDPNNSSRAIAATCYAAASTPHPNGYCKAWNSTDYGEHWSAALLDSQSFETDRAQDTIHFAFQKAAPGSTPTIYAQYGDAQGQPTPTPPASPTPYQNTMSRSTDGGNHFSTANMVGSPGITQGVHAFWVSPPPTLGFNFISIVTGGKDLVRSNNNGASFEEHSIANGETLADPVNPHQDMQMVVTDPRPPNNEKKAFVLTDGGIYHTNDITAATGTFTGGTPTVTPSGWTSLNDTLQNTQYYSVAGVRSGSTEMIVGGTQDNGSLRLGVNVTVTTSPTPYSLISTDAYRYTAGDGGASAVDVDANGVFYCYGRDSTGPFYRLDDCAHATGPDPHPDRITDSSYIPDYLQAQVFILDLNSSNHERAFLGARSVWKTENVKSGDPHPIWTPIKTPEGSPQNVQVDVQVTAMAVAPGDSSYMWVAENNGNVPDHGRLWRSTDALSPSPSPMPTWSRMDDNGTAHLPDRPIQKILIEQNSNGPDGIVYVGFGGFVSHHNLWRTVDHGQQWESISGAGGDCLPNHSLNGNLPCAPVRAIARHPSNSSILFVGTEIGLYVTTNLNANPSSSIVWCPVMEGPSNVSIDDL